MTTVMVFNFETMKYEQASDSEADELLNLIQSLNDDYVKNKQTQKQQDAAQKKQVAP